MKLETQKTALTVGIFLGALHLLWSILVAISVAQPLMDFIFWAHMIVNPYHITGFSLTQSATLVILTFVVGYLGGWVFAKVWNYLHNK